MVVGVMCVLHVLQCTAASSSDSSCQPKVVSASFSDESVDEGEGEWDVLGRSVHSPHHEPILIFYCVQDEFRAAFQ